MEPPEGVYRFARFPLGWEQFQDTFEPRRSKLTTAQSPQKLPAPPRVVITQVDPEIDGGRYPIKRVVGESVAVAADIFTDGHELLAAVLRTKEADGENWLETAMREGVNDRWTGEFVVVSPGVYEYTIEAWVDPFKSWRRDLRKKLEAGQDLTLELLSGALLADEAAQRASETGAPAAAAELREFALKLRAGHKADAASGPDPAGSFAATQAALDEDLAALMDAHPDRRFASTYRHALRVVVEREIARFGAWYEMFPRSCAANPGQHGTLRDCEARLPYIADMGFDVLYLPPIHPIGRAHRKGKNNTALAAPDDVGSPWAIGAEEGGHTSIHPQLGTIDDFERLLAKCHERGLELAMDLAYQCSPDHPWVREHPEWFRHRPDGSIQYAENPPKKYQDIYPLCFECEQWQSLWKALKDVVFFWMGQGIRIFRVDNPHTKPFAFWEWLIGEVKASDPGVIFLAEAFTRPKVMKHLAKLGFSQSYTYFTWRNAKRELAEYFTELTGTDMREYFRPNLWPNTPDILHATLQHGGRAAFMARLVLAATLGSSYGIYGPAFELCENAPRDPGREEYLHAEKYEIRRWDLSQPGNLTGLIARVNRARRENPALQSHLGLRFHTTDNEQIIAYSKSTEDLSNRVLTVVNLDAHNIQSGWVTLPLEELGLSTQLPFQAQDLLTDARYVWQGPRNYVQLDPARLPAHVFHIRRPL